MKSWLLCFCLTASVCAQSTENLKTRVSALYADSFETLGVQRVGLFALVTMRAKDQADLGNLVYRWHPGRGWIQLDLHRRGLGKLSVEDLLECGFTRRQMSDALGRPLTAQERQTLSHDRPFSDWLSSRKLLADQQQDGLANDPWLLMLLRNEIYARHGRAFQDPELKAIFSERSWYHPDPQYSDALLTPVEDQNVRVLLKWERRPLGKLTVINP